MSSFPLNLSDGFYFNSERIKSELFPKECGEELLINHIISQRFFSFDGLELETMNYAINIINRLNVYLIYIITKSFSDTQMQQTHFIMSSVHSHLNNMHVKCDYNGCFAQYFILESLYKLFLVRVNTYILYIIIIHTLLRENSTVHIL